MKRALSIAATMLACAGPVSADDCRDEIAALYADGGAMDPFARPPHRQTVTEFTAEGTRKRWNLNIFETPMRTIAGSPDEKHFTMAIDRDLWNGPSVDGPWTTLGSQMPEGRDAAMRAGNAQNAANLAEPECLGVQDDGTLRYAYRTQTDKDENGTFFGAHYTVWIDPETNHATRIHMTDFINSWSEGTSSERQEIVLDYDPSIRVLRPE